MDEQNNPIIRRFQDGRKRVAATPTWTVNGCFVVMIFWGSAQGVTQGDTQSDTQDGTQDGTQCVTQDVTQDVPQGVPQDNELDDWIEKQIQNNPQISTDDLAELSNRSSKTTDAICDSGLYDLQQSKKCIS